jgi:hypothetical protein
MSARLTVPTACVMRATRIPDKQPLTVITGLRICGRMNLDQNMMALPSAWISSRKGGTMRRMHRRVTIICGMVCSAMICTGTATDAYAASSSGLAGDSQLSGSAVAVSVAIPTGWHQLVDQNHPQLLQMVYPQTCSQGPQCASALARLVSDQAASAHDAALAAEQAITSLSGVQGARVTREGPLQIAGHNGYQVRFVYSHANTQFQAATAAIETGPAASGMAPTSLIFVTVSDRAGAPPASVIDEIMGSAQLAAQQK